MKYDQWFQDATQVMIEYLFERFHLDRDIIVVVVGNIFEERKAILKVIGRYDVPYGEENPKDYGLDAAMELAEQLSKQGITTEWVETVARRWMVKQIIRKYVAINKRRD